MPMVAMPAEASVLATAITDERSAPRPCWNTTTGTLANEATSGSTSVNGTVAVPSGLGTPSVSSKKPSDVAEPPAADSGAAAFR